MKAKATLANVTKAVLMLGPLRTAVSEQKPAAKKWEALRKLVAPMAAWGSKTQSDVDAMLAGGNEDSIGKVGAFLVAVGQKARDMTTDPDGLNRRRG